MEQLTITIDIKPFSHLHQNSFINPLLLCIFVYNCFFRSESLQFFQRKKKKTKNSQDSCIYNIISIYGTSSKPLDLSSILDAVKFFLSFGILRAASYFLPSYGSAAAQSSQRWLIHGITVTFSAKKRMGPGRLIFIRGQLIPTRC